MIINVGQQMQRIGSLANQTNWRDQLRNTKKKKIDKRKIKRSPSDPTDCTRRLCGQEEGAGGRIRLHR